MKVGVPRESREGERRVAATPETVGQLKDLGVEIQIEAGAGTAAGYPDSAYTDAGARVVPQLDTAGLDVYCHVRPLTPAQATGLSRGTITIGLASPAAELDTVSALATAGVTAFALELVPRISRAQSMDALSSQSLVAGYRAVLEAAIRFPRFFPLYMTAAGTIPPARVLVLGAGVAGLQAIGTAKRLGARVSAYDVRPASADEVTSMGGTFINLDLDAVEGAGGYARELSEDRSVRQRELLAPYVAAADVLITTAAIPGRPAPLLVTGAMVAAMRAGSVVIDLAAETGGNVEGVVAGQDVGVPTTAGDGAVILVGMKDAPSAMPTDASRLYAKNVANLLALMTSADGIVAPDFTDEVLAGACLTHDGKVTHAPTATALEGER
ncbi:Re/Si-specific NAD(P)(+) transhydrogenase subunit alpha [Cryobacterium sp. Sr8]|uniref:proton-translocating NAD(P)(+) transhydrogenase n=1 Tax=Cryobacterium psychrotolerans TaxID=386301 RepID=A0A1G9BGI6_9MICO|nr:MULTISPECIES: Re/Si-specific NAD(P)(+) transhydrogenase subunit alpha [Cryobacterium]TFD46226.1 Re/Si-specific NAD(P)(+) transhydrogenase subunit alpha [Cryobacterium sp. TMT1-2-1]TFD74938.1 Re/Si-specific NAD(P)(+) transhydrogenase subunit alpha [Cryobacterium sp. Sr8]TFD84741.1 Re/Si-specific NAD(P)(+) transhydrogenase subunit alpha [Cryobacterium psychrotolerans]SDK38611.1 NAD(P) transhydrogenase subunit alpha [Cryobacterium psychrotolerans]